MKILKCTLCKLLIYLQVFFNFVLSYLLYTLFLHLQYTTIVRCRYYYYFFT